MDNRNEFYIVAADVLPEALKKTAQIKALLSQNSNLTINEAADKVGLSRSAFYKYKDFVSPFQDMSRGHLVTFNLELLDRQGVLSSVLAIFAENGANILTINQSIPTNGCAAVTISAETSDMRESLEELIASAAETAGVVKFEILAG